MNPVLSICVLTYNRPNFLMELLNSIFTLDKSSLDQIEIIVIDNGSTDETWQILNKYSYHRNFISERFSENLRGSASYLELIKRVNGDFVIFPGDDDVFKTNTLSKAIKFLSEFGEKYSLIAFGADTINEYGKSNLFSYRPPSKYSRDQIAAKLLVDSVFWMPCTIVKTNVVKEKNDPLTITAFDWWIWISGIIKGEIKFFESDLISYRQHDGQEQNSFLKLNWEVDSFLMLSRELESDFGKYIRDLLENKTNFLFGVRQFILRRGYLLRSHRRFFARKLLNDRTHSKEKQLHFRVLLTNSKSNAPILCQRFSTFLFRFCRPPAF